MTTFHLALTVHDLDEAKRFYCDTLGCPPTRSAKTWQDVDFFGHQLSLHLDQTMQGRPVQEDRGLVDGIAVPMPHFGVVLEIERWNKLVARIRDRLSPFTIEPQGRFVGESFEQSTFFLCDPSGNHLEFKGVASNVNLLTTQN